MSEADPDIDADALAELVQMDLAAARHANAQFLAATAPDEINGLGRTYQRMARSLRQSLALKAKLKHDAEAAAAKASAPAPRAKLDAYAEDLADDQRIDDVMEAVGRVIVASTDGEPISTNEAFDRLDREADDWIIDELFALEDLDDHVANVCKALGLPEDLARNWRKLPKVLFAPDPATNPPADDASKAPAADPPVPNSDTG